MPSYTFRFSVSLAISLAVSPFHWIHVSRFSSDVPVVLACLFILRHHLVRLLSAEIIFAINSGVNLHVCTPYNRHGLTSACNNFNLMAWEVEVLLNSVAFACAAFQACLNLCWKQCVESFRNATSWPRIVSAA